MQILHLSPCLWPAWGCGDVALRVWLLARALGALFATVKAALAVSRVFLVPEDIGTPPGAIAPSSTKAPPSPLAQKPRSSIASTVLIVNASYTCAMSMSFGPRPAIA